MSYTFFFSLTHDGTDTQFYNVSRLRMERKNKAFATVNLTFPISTKATWTARLYCSIIVYESSIKIFEGRYISYTETPDTITINCYEFSRMLEWNILDSTQSDFVINEGLVGDTPVAGTLDLHTSDDDPAALTDNLYNKTAQKEYNIIVGDATTDDVESTVVYTGHDHIGKAGSTTDLTVGSGTYENVNHADAGDGSYWYGYFTPIAAGQTKYMRLHLNIQDMLYDKDWVLTRIRSYIRVKTYVDPMIAAYPFTVELWLSATTTRTNGIKLGTYTHTAGTIENVYLVDRQLYPSEGAKCFTQGATYWEGGYLWLHIIAANDLGGDAIGVYWDSATLYVTYRTLDIPELNYIITDNNAASLTAEDENGVPIDFSDYNVATQDRWYITHSIQTIVNEILGHGNLGTSFPYGIMLATNPKLGLNKAEVGMNSKDLLDSIIDFIEYYWYPKYDSFRPYVYITDTLEWNTGASVPWTDYKTFSKAEGGFLINSFVCFGKISTKHKEVAGSTSPISLMDVRSDLRADSDLGKFIDEKIIKYGTEKPMIHVEFDIYMIAEVGRKQIVTIAGVDITSIIESVVYEWNGGKSKTITKVELGEFD
jgi:hypothetical protein